jgi:type IV pilus assembly protein PilB
MPPKIGDLLLKAKLISQEQLDEALKKQKEVGGKIGEHLVKLGHVTEQDITEVLSQQYSVPAVDLDHLEIDDNVIKLIGPDHCRKYQVVPVSKFGATLTVAMADPSNVFALDDLKFLTGYNIEPVVASDMAIVRALDKYFGTDHSVELKKVMDDLAQAEDAAVEVMEDEDTMDVAKLEAESEEAPVIRLVNLILTDAIKRKASDIHIEPYEKEFRVRFRMDGVLYEMMNPPLKLRDAIISRIKILSKLDIAEKRLPQDGRIKLKMKLQERTKEIDFRVSVLPILFGEKIVMRLLDKDNLMLDLTKLGFEKESLKKFEEAIFKPWGMVLVTGPTGSGKTNTLYSSVGKLNTPEVNIMTAEDPVEFNIPGINQVQMHDAIGLNFAATLRSFLRQDPNIILVGEIRDFETAEIAVKAALTGHMVLSTLHTNDAPSTITRLVNMGIEPFLVATSVNLIAAQRLIRRVCTNCKEEVDIPMQALINIGFSPEEAKQVKIYKGRGCEICNKTGYKGRIALYEVMEMTDDLRELVLSGASAMELKQKALEEGMITLRRSGLIKIKNGITSIEEVVRETVL